MEVVVGGDHVRETFDPLPYTHWGLIANFRDHDACDEIGKYVVKRKKDAMPRDILFAMMSNYSRSATATHKVVLAKGPDDLKLMSVEQLGRIRATESVDILIEALGGTSVESTVKMSESNLARVHLIIRTDPADSPRIQVRGLERRLEEALDRQLCAPPGIDGPAVAASPSIVLGGAEEPDMEVVIVR